MTQRTIGIRDAKAQLSKVLNDIKQGGEWIITDRGRPVAKLIPVPTEELSPGDRIRRLEEQGWIEPLSDSSGALPTPLPLEGEPAQAWLKEDRDRGTV